MTYQTKSFAICPYSVIPMRKLSQAKSPMVSQVLFGELVIVLKNKHSGWSYVRCVDDGFEAWVQKSQILFLKEKQFEKAKANNSYALELVQNIMGEDGVIPIPIAASLPAFDGILLRIGKKKYNYTGQALNPDALDLNEDMLVNICRRYLHSPCLIGGRSPFGIDSAGLVYNICRMLGKDLSRNLAEQIKQGRLVDFAANATVGDLAYFYDENGVINHAGIILKDQKIIHADGSVRIDKIDHVGIYNVDLKKYTHSLRLIKRHFDFQKVDV